MSGLIKRLEEMKKDLESLDRERVKQEMLRDQAVDMLKEMGYDSVEEAQAAALEMEKDIEKSELEAEAYLTELKE